MSAAITALPLWGLTHRCFASSMSTLFRSLWRNAGHPCYSWVTQFLHHAGIAIDPAERLCVMKVFDKPAILDLVKAWHPSKEEQKMLMDRVRSERIHACAEAWCLVGCDVHRDTEKLKPWFPNVWPPSKYEIQNAGGVTAIKDRIRQGGLSVSEELRPWTGGFFAGLRMSGAIKPESQIYDGRWQVWKAHRELVNDLLESNIVKKFRNYLRTPDVFRLSRCPALLLPPDEPMGPDVVAGMFAGAQLIQYKDETWFGVPDTEAVRDLLEHWSIVPHHKDKYMGKRRLGISPFYAALFAHLMPMHSADRVLNVKGPAICPLLPQVYWDILFSKEHARIMTFAEALPFGCSVRTYRRRGWQRRDLHRQAVTSLGITGVSRSLKELIHRWYQEACEKRSANANTNGQRIPGLVATVPG